MMTEDLSHQKARQRVSRLHGHKIILSNPGDFVLPINEDGAMELADWFFTLQTGFKWNSRVSSLGGL
jgi:hypothetical protein